MVRRFLIVVLAGACFLCAGCPAYVAATVDAREKARRVANLANLRQVYVGLQTYRSTNGQYPPSLNALAAGGQVDPAMLKMPQSKTGRPVDYLYAPAVGVAGNFQAILLCDRKGNLKGGRCVVRADGSAEFLEDAKFQSELRKPYNSAMATLVAAE